MLDPDLCALAEGLEVGYSSAALLHAAGIRTSNVAMLEWLPAVAVAWVDGVDPIERVALSHAFAAYGPATSDSAMLLDTWLTHRPSDALIAAGRAAVRAMLRRLPVDTRRQVLESIVAKCEFVARATGHAHAPDGVSASELDQIQWLWAELEMVDAA